MGVLSFLQPVEHAASNAVHDTLSFLKPVVPAAQGLAATAEHIGGIVPSIAKTIPASLTGNKVAEANASKEADSDIHTAVEAAQSIPRGVIQLRQSVAHVIDPNNPTTGNVTLPNNPITGNAPIPTIQSQFKQTEKQTGSKAQAAGGAVLSFLGDFAGLTGGVKAADEFGSKVADVAANATPLNEVGAIGKDVRPAENPTPTISTDDLHELTQAKTTDDVQKILTDKIDPNTAEQIAPAILQTKDPGIIDNIITRATSPPEPEPVAPTLLPQPAEPAPISDVTKPPTTVPAEPAPDLQSDKPVLSNPEIQKAVDRATKPVDTGTFNVNENAKNFKAPATAIRTAYSGEKNAQQQAAAVLAETLKKAAPDEQGAIYWYRDQGGNTDNLQTLLNNPDPKLDPYREDIQKALNLSPAAKQVSAALDQIYEKAGKNAVDQGTLKDVLNDYGNTRLYKQEDQQAGVGAVLKQSTGAAKHRVYSTAADAVLNGKELATTDASDVATVHLADLARVNTTRNLLDNLEKSGLGKWGNPNEIPSGWAKVGDSLRNGSQVFSAPADLSKRLSAITDPSFLGKVDSIKKIGAYQGLVKTVDLALSTFHAITFISQALTNTKFGFDVLKNGTQFLDKIDSPEFADNENLFYQAGGLTTKAAELQDITRNLADTGTKSILGKVQDFPIAKQFLQLTDKVTSALFDKGQRWLKVTDFTNKFENYAAKHPDASPEELTTVAQGFAKEVNATYGGINWEAMGISKSSQGILRLALLAPDWVVSNISLGKYALSDSGVAGHAARAQLFNALSTGMVATQVLNKAITGHYTNENPKGHEFDVQLAPNVYITLFRGGPGEALKLFQDIQDNGVAQGTARYFQGKASPLLRTAIGLGSGTQFTGQPINNPNDNFVQKVGDESKYIAEEALPIPFGISSGLKYAHDASQTHAPINPLVEASLATGAARYSKTSNGLSTREQAVIQQLTKGGAPKQEVDAVNEFYLTAKAGAVGRGKVSSAIDLALSKGDQAKAQQLAADYNKKYAAAFKGWVQKYGTYSNSGLVKAYNSHKINLTPDSIQTRLNSIKDNPLYTATTGG